MSVAEAAEAFAGPGGQPTRSRVREGLGAARVWGTCSAPGP